ncbi:MAG: APC family permease [Oscillospiraceae bacterium]
MEKGLSKKYGLFTAIAMVVGIVIGSGVFFKAEAILTKTGGDMVIGILAWVIGGLIMMICAYTFAVMATKFEYVNGLVDYAEATAGKRYGYLVGWFMSTIYYPAMTSVLAWVSARYLCVLFGFDIAGAQCMVIAGFFLIASYALNALSPVLAGKFQVSTTVIKLVPLALMAVFGIIFGLKNGVLVENFTHVIPTAEIETAFAAAGKTYAPSSSPFLASVVAAAFAYEGWIIATCINSEVKDSKKNLPRALVIGTAIITATYILYYIGLSGAIDKLSLMISGEAGARSAFTNLFSSAGGTLLGVFIVVSCLGTLNGLMLGCTRGFYSLAARNAGPRPDILRQVDPATNMPNNSAIVALLVCSMWLVYFFGANLTGPAWFGPFCFDSSELPIITIYAFYIPVFLIYMKKSKSLEIGVFKGKVMPILATCGCLFMVFAACMAHGIAVLFYLVIFAVIMVAGNLFYGRRRIEAAESSHD